MSAMKPLGIVLLLLSLPLLVCAVLLLFMDEAGVPKVIGDDATKTGIGAAAVGGLFLVLGILFLALGPKKVQPAPVVAAGPAPQTYEIKRTQMDLGSTAQRTVTDELQAQVDAIDQKMGRLKVQFGMGELSSESYKTLMAQYEQEKSAVERQILAQQGR